MSRLQQRVDRDLTERILLEALRFAYDIYGRCTVVQPPKRPNYIDIEAAYMVGFAICYNQEKKEFFYHQKF